MPDSANAPAAAFSPAVAGPLPIPYTAEEVGRIFADQIATFTFAAELQELGIGRINIIKRARARRHLFAVCIALWHVALEKSFPNNADVFFERFAETYPSMVGDRSGAKDLRNLVSLYDTLIAEKKDGDFLQVAETLLEALQIQGGDRRRQRLRLSLQVRTLYEFIFEKLI